MNENQIEKIALWIETHRWRLHILFWVSVILAYIFEGPFLITSLGVPYFSLFVAVKFIFIAICVYLNLYVLLPKYYKNRNLKAYLALLTLSLTVITLIQNQADVMMYTHVYKTKTELYMYAYFFVSQMVCNLWHVGTTTALSYTKQFFFQTARLKQIEIEQLHTEIKYLTAQINPHFLFNALNSVYVQIDKTNVAARETLSKFAELLRYQLYECNTETVSLTKEIEYLKNYVDLERLRKSKRYHIDFDVSEPKEDVAIPPLLLLGFVENAFKHISHSKDKDNYVKIKIGLHEKTLNFSVENSKDIPKNAEENSKSNGIGLKNIQKRLALQFPNKHFLNIQETDKTYHIDLKLYFA
jgi:sensor histidine kinase YesM